MHSFLEIDANHGRFGIGLLALAAGPGARSRDAWRLRWKKEPLPTGYLAAIGACVVVAVALPYGEELHRCITKANQR